jgi:hypothetical protein
MNRNDDTGGSPSAVNDGDDGQRGDDLLVLPSKTERSRPLRKLLAPDLEVPPDRPTEEAESNSVWLPRNLSPSHRIASRWAVPAAASSREAESPQTPGRSGSFLGSPFANLEPHATSELTDVARERHPPVQSFKRTSGRTLGPGPNQNGDGDLAEMLGQAGAGTPLSASVKAKLDPLLGFDTSAVRVHVGPAAALAARAVGAEAFVTGRDIYFNEGRFDPSSPEGLALIAHELAHVVQQSRGGLSAKEFAQREASMEDAARSVGDLVLAEQSQPGVSVHRYDRDYCCDTGTQEDLSPGLLERLDRLSLHALEVATARLARECRSSHVLDTVVVDFAIEADTMRDEQIVQIWSDSIVDAVKSRLPQRFELQRPAQPGPAQFLQREPQPTSVANEFVDPRIPGRRLRWIGATLNGLAMYRIIGTDIVFFFKDGIYYDSNRVQVDDPERWGLAEALVYNALPPPDPPPDGPKIKIENEAEAIRLIRIDCGASMEPSESSLEAILVRLAKEKPRDFETMVVYAASHLPGPAFMDFILLVQKYFSQLSEDAIRILKHRLRVELRCRGSSTLDFCELSSPITIIDLSHRPLTCELSVPALAEWIDKALLTELAKELPDLISKLAKTSPRHLEILMALLEKRLRRDAEERSKIMGPLRLCSEIIPELHEEIIQLNLPLLLSMDVFKPVRKFKNGDRVKTRAGKHGAVTLWNEDGTYEIEVDEEGRVTVPQNQLDEENEEVPGATDLLTIPLDGATRLSLTRACRLDKSKTLVMRAQNTGDMYQVKGAMAANPGFNLLIWNVCNTTRKQAQEVVDLVSDLTSNPLLDHRVYYVCENSMPDTLNLTETRATEMIESHLSRKTNAIFGLIQKLEKVFGIEHKEFFAECRRALKQINSENKIALHLNDYYRRLQILSLAQNYAPYTSEEGEAFERDLIKLGKFVKGKRYVIVNFRATGHSSRPGANAPALDTGLAGMRQLIRAVKLALGDDVVIVPMGEEPKELADCPNLLNYWRWPSAGTRRMQAALLKYLNDHFDVIGVIGMRSGVMDQLVISGFRIISIDISPHKYDAETGFPDLSTSKGWDRGEKLERGYGDRYGRVYLKQKRKDEKTRNLENWEGEFDTRDMLTIEDAISHYFSDALSPSSRHSSHPKQPKEREEAVKKLNQLLLEKRVTGCLLITSIHPYVSQCCTWGLPLSELHEKVKLRIKKIEHYALLEVTKVFGVECEKASKKIPVITIQWLTNYFAPWIDREMDERMTRWLNQRFPDLDADLARRIYRLYFMIYTKEFLFFGEDEFKL